MASVIDSSFGPKTGIEVRPALFGGIKFRVLVGWKAHSYKGKDVSEVIPIDREAYRSAGGAAAGAIIGGLLTGGIGLIAGAAIGGRRKKEASYLVRFTDGQHVAFTETSGAVIKLLDAMVSQEKVRELARA